MAQSLKELYEELKSRTDAILPKIQAKMDKGPGTATGVVAEPGEALAEMVPQQDVTESAGTELTGATYADRRLQAAGSALENARNT